MTSKRNKCETCGINANFNIKGILWGRFCSKHKQINMINVKNKLCEHVGCTKSASFNYNGEKIRRFCNIHKLIGMINVKDKKCEYKGCDKIPVFNVKGEKKRRFCSIHKLIGMVDVYNKLCEYNGCNKSASFSYKGETKRRFCVYHKNINMSNNRNNKCQHTGCKKTAHFNYKGEKHACLCGKHKNIGMINVKSKTCKYQGCKKQPSFNFKGGLTSLFCKEHKEKEMIDVKSKQCNYLGCTKQPSFNFYGKTDGLFCKEHKEKDMVNIKSRRCNYIGCIKRPIYNYSTEIIALFCNKHKSEGMVNIKDIKCSHTGCTKIAHFNDKHNKTPKFCGEHKENDMINVKSKLCNHPDCNVITKYGYCNQYASKCYKHKLEYMIRKPNTRKCIGDDTEECKDSAMYGNKEPIHCEKHSQKEEFCWLVRPCTSCGRENEILNKEGLCYFVCSSEKLYVSKKTQQKIKEMNMVRYLKQNLILPKHVIELPCDKIVNVACNLYRPDLPYDCGSHIVVIECDEEQHKSYNWESCLSNRNLRHAEEKRMYEIMIAYEGKPVIFLRWNPDSFTINKLLCKKYTQDKRLIILNKWVNHCINLDISDIKSLCQYKQLFYDEFDESDVSFISIDEKNLL